MAYVNIFAGWIGMLAGVVSGAIIGLCFHREDWLGGYTSYPRRLIRLGHISFFGLGLLNILFGLTSAVIHLHGPGQRIASPALIVGAIAMPACCFLSAWKKPLRHLFPIPVIAVAKGICALLIEWGKP